MIELRQKAISGLFWTFSQQFSVQIINFAVSIVLARLLLPAEFGLLGMIAIFMAIGQSLINSGLTSSLIRTKDADNEDFSTVFYFNLIGSILVYLILYIFAPYIGDFYDQPILTQLIRVYSITFIISSFSSVQDTILTKEMEFRKQMTIQIPSVIVSSITGITLAFLEFGVWSLIYMNLCQSTLNSIQLWIRSDWKPSLTFKKAKFRYHFNYGYKLTLSGILNTIFDHAYHIIIGKYFSASQLGFYTRANSLKQLPVQNISAALGKVTFPLFANIQDDNTKLKDIYKRLVQQVTFWILPTLSQIGRAHV